MRAHGLLALGPLALLAAAVAHAAPARAQTPPPPRPGPAATELVFDREVFRYPSFTRRNPFRPQGAADAGGPRFEQLTLIGVMYSTDPGASVAVVSTGGVAVAADGTTTAIPGDAYNLKVGDQLGNTTIRAIHRDRVEVTVSEFDEQIPRTMIFVSRRPGGTP